ncbi:MAG: transcription termination/antitermination NusG family protein [Verrucomicrobiota bacterium]|nr:transcription termination/antitermination NusG family protein [Verrucomicrobiota bacterium]
MKKEWFVLQTLTGQENKVQRSVQARIVPEGMSEYVGACIIPTEKVTETRDGKKRTLNRKVFPGYVLIEMALYEEGKKDPQTGKREIVDRTWQFLRETPGVIGSWLMLARRRSRRPRSTRFSPRSRRRLPRSRARRSLSTSTRR